MTFDFKELQLLVEALKLIKKEHESKHSLWHSRGFTTSAKRYKTLIRRGERLTEEFEVEINKIMKAKEAKHMQSKKYLRGLTNIEE